MLPARPRSLDRHEIPFIEDSAIPHLRDALDRIRWTTGYVESPRDLRTGLLEAQHLRHELPRPAELDWVLGYPFALGTLLLMTFGLSWFEHKKWL
jgi:hypothetical protein